MRQSTLLTVLEWRALPADEHDLTPGDIDRLHVAAKRAARRLALPEDAVLKRTENGLRGDIRLPDCALGGVLPRVARPPVSGGGFRSQPVRNLQGLPMAGPRRV